MYHNQVMYPGSAPSMSFETDATGQSFSSVSYPMDFVNEDSQVKNRESKLRSSASNYLNKSLGEDRAKAVLEFMDLFIDAADVHSSEAIAYVAFLCMLLTSAYFVTEPHVGIMYMLGAAFQVLGLILLDVKLLRDRKASGVSCYALSALAISTGFRVRAMLGGAYIPMDALGGNIYIGMQIFIMMQVLVTLGICTSLILFIF